VIHALPCLYALRSLYPEAEISWAVEPRFSALLPGPPWIDRQVPFRKTELKALPLFGKIRALAALRRGLRSLDLDLALDLQGLMKSALIAALSGSPLRLGYCEMREGSFLVSRPVKGPHAQGHVIERYLDVVRSLGPVPARARFPLPDARPEAERFRGELLAMGLRGPLALLFPGAGWPSKLWPTESYARLARMLAQDGMAVAAGGGPEDGPLARRVAALSGLPSLPDLTGRTDLRGLMGLVRLAAVCVGSDTGPLHLAAAQGTPTVSLFGPSSGLRAGTWGRLARYVASDAPCSPCFKRRCPRREFICMEAIGPGEVMASCRELLALTPPKELESP
jgi:heptosyltransferase-1/heptosyltransferase-2